MNLLLYVTLVGLWLLPLRREAARIRLRKAWDRMAKHLSEALEPFVEANRQLAMSMSEAAERVQVFSLAVAGTQVNTQVPDDWGSSLGRDGATGVTLDELLGDIDTLIGDDRG